MMFMRLTITVRTWVSLLPQADRSQGWAQNRDTELYMIQKPSVASWWLGPSREAGGGGEEEADEDLCRVTRAVDLTRGYIARRVSARDCNGARR